MPFGAAGDVNGDGFADVVVGNYADEHARVYFGGATGLSDASSVRMNHPDTAGSAGQASFGFAVWTAGDLDGDGLCDLAVGAPYLDVGGVRAGRVYVYRGVTGAGFSATPAWTFNAPMPGGSFGAAVRSAGDANGDGYSDLLVGAPVLNSNAGQAYLFAGGTGISSTVAPLAIAPPDFQGVFGCAVSGLGDVTGDGTEDVGVGALGLGVGGGVSVFYGASAFPASPAITVEGVATSGTFGTSIAVRPLRFRHRAG